MQSVSKGAGKGLIPVQTLAKTIGPLGLMWSVSKGAGQGLIPRSVRSNLLQIGKCNLQSVGLIGGRAGHTLGTCLRHSQRLGAFTKFSVNL